MTDQSTAITALEADIVAGVAGDTSDLIAILRGINLAARSVETHAAISSENLSDTSVTHIRTGGYTTAGDGGGALYKRVGSQPTHGARAQSNDGAHWELVPEGAVSVLQTGATGDGATDDTAAIQAACDVANDVHFPPGTYAVVPIAAQNYAVRVYQKSIRLRGAPGAVVSMATTDVKQAIRLEECDNSEVTDLRIVGSNTNGADGGQGIFQFNSSDNVRAHGLNISNANCDGLVFSSCTGVQIGPCIFDNCSKTSLYVNDCDRVEIAQPVVTNIGGHTVSGNLIGAGIQLSGNHDLIMHGGIVENGTGAGVIIDNSTTRKPHRNTVIGARVRGVSNPTNTGTSNGFRLTNGDADKLAQTILRDCVATACGLYGFYIENHDGSTLRGCRSEEADRSSFIVSTIDGLEVSDCEALNTNTSNTAGQYAFLGINSPSNVVGRGNVARTQTGMTASYGSHTVSGLFGSSGNAVSLGRNYKTSEYSFTWHPNSGSSIAAGSAVSATFGSVADVSLGAYVEVVAPYTLNDCLVGAYAVASSGSVRVTLFNASGAARTFASGTWTIRVHSPNT